MRRPWKTKLEVNEILSNDELGEREKTTRVLALLRGELENGSLAFLGVQVTGDLEYIADDLELILDDTPEGELDETAADQVDDALSGLYSWGDDNRVWLGLPT